MSGRLLQVVGVVTILGLLAGVFAGFALSHAALCDQLAGMNLGEAEA